MKLKKRKKCKKLVVTVSSKFRISNKAKNQYLDLTQYEVKEAIVNQTLNRFMRLLTSLIIDCELKKLKEQRKNE